MSERHCRTCRQVIPSRTPRCPSCYPAEGIYTPREAPVISAVTKPPPTATGVRELSKALGAGWGAPPISTTVPGALEELTEALHGDVALAAEVAHHFTKKIKALPDSSVYVCKLPTGAGAEKMDIVKKFITKSLEEIRPGSRVLVFSDEIELEPLELSDTQELQFQIDLLKAEIKLLRGFISNQAPETSLKTLPSWEIHEKDPDNFLLNELLLDVGKRIPDPPEEDGDLEEHVKYKKKKSEW